MCHESKKSGRGVREGEEVKRRKNTETCCILCVEVCAGVNRDNKDKVSTEIEFRVKKVNLLIKPLVETTPLRFRLWCCYPFLSAFHNLQQKV